MLSYFKKLLIILTLLASIAFLYFLTEDNGVDGFILGLLMLGSVAILLHVMSWCFRKDKLSSFKKILVGLAIAFIALLIVLIIIGITEGGGIGFGLALIALLIVTVSTFFLLFFVRGILLLFTKHRLEATQETKLIIDTRSSRRMLALEKSLFWIAAILPHLTVLLIIIEESDPDSLIIYLLSLPLTLGIGLIALGILYFLKTKIKIAALVLLVILETSYLVFVTTQIFNLL